MLATLPATYRRLCPLAVAAALLYGVSLAAAPYRGQFAAKAAMGILLLAAGSTLRAPRERAWLVAALAAAVLGDVLLALPDSPFTFMGGLGAFLLTHLCYCAIFLRWRARPHGWGVAALVVLWIAAPAFYVAFFPHLGELAVPVAVYMLVLVAMASFALAADTHAPLVAIGSLIFVGSDTLIGVERFLGGFPSIGPAIWALYALAQVVIVTGVFHETTERSVRP
ncbi:lysoplasmalogenase [Burkholderia multivorans]|uniref:lysoplasmalogenase n=1 Tax=Burkholderia multivorans TaxID=87883 RepID=UPI0012DD8487|nr:lysoplasmalogenase [Burkholderia multivorans]MBU9337998.1 lysoplasmalogenase [Burkholderia multivorans]MCA8138782.1 lysoplasmalogenase [Burkholderia multivorans]MCO1363789.1 lysoplasmalogenase [Burkholderia multivorans]MCO1379171.1 lysoplasmalogenase [Burkholderia multivorans]QGR62684.1 lysoplasmalogenase [Burkholderia multivorans]